MLPSLTPTTERPRIRTEREYQEWRRSLLGNVPVKRLKNEPGFLTRLVHLIRRRVMARRAYSTAKLRRIEQS